MSGDRQPAQRIVLVHVKTETASSPGHGALAAGPATNRHYFGNEKKEEKEKMKQKSIRNWEIFVYFVSSSQASSYLRKNAILS